MNTRTRRFHLADLMILIAAIGSAMMLLRNLWRGATTKPEEYFWSVTPNSLLAAAVLSACAVPMSLACVVFRLRQPRRSWRRVALQPGMAAVMVASVMVVFQAAEVVAAMLTPKVEFFSKLGVSTVRFGPGTSIVVMQDHMSNGMIGNIEPLACFGVLTISLATPCGPAVAATWLLLALSGRWRPEASWIDRLGRGLGLIWIVVSILAILPVIFL